MRSVAAAAAGSEDGRDRVGAPLIVLSDHIFMYEFQCDKCVICESGDLYSFDSRTAERMWAIKMLGLAL